MATKQIDYPAIDYPAIDYQWRYWQERAMVDDLHKSLKMADVIPQRQCNTRSDHASYHIIIIQYVN